MTACLVAEAVAGYELLRNEELSLRIVGCHEKKRRIRWLFAEKGVILQAQYKIY